MHAQYTHFIDKRHVVGLDLLHINVNLALAIQVVLAVVTIIYSNLEVVFIRIKTQSELNHVQEIKLLENV